MFEQLLKYLILFKQNLIDLVFFKIVDIFILLLIFISNNFNYININFLF